MTTSTRLSRLGRPRRVAVLRALQLGDLLCAVPALRSLRAALPGAEVVLIGLPWARAFADRYDHLVDGFLEFPGYPGLPERHVDVARIPSFLAAAQARRFDLAVQLHGSGSFVNELTALLGAARCAGFYTPGGYCPDPELFLEYPDHGLEVQRLLALTRYLGAPDLGADLEFPLRDEDFVRLRAVKGESQLRVGDFVCMHPGASVPERRWPAARFAEVARWLSGRGLGVVLTGTASERPLADEVAARFGGPCLNLAGRTDLGALAALLVGARLLVCNDTGVAHLAAALELPAVIISTGNNPARWAPADRRHYRVLCDDSGVPARDVIDRAAELLTGQPAGTPWKPAHCRGTAPAALISEV
jgi:ADP-heptose:LPS heptosyltransferase